MTSRTSFSRVDSRFRITIQKAVRERLRLKPGDFVRYVMDGRSVAIERMNAERNPFAAFEEWASQAD
jgi:AbrB family looped-hinge helix DNA binding protein